MFFFSLDFFFFPAYVLQCQCQELLFFIFSNYCVLEKNSPKMADECFSGLAGCALDAKM